MTRASDRIACALVLVLAMLVPRLAHAQAQHAFAFEPPPCGPAWWEPTAFVSALAVELVTLEGVLSATASCGALSIELECRDESALARFHVEHEGALLDRVVELDDVAPSMRIRALALAAHDAIAEALASAPERSPQEQLVVAAVEAPEPPDLSATRDASELSDPRAA